MASIPLPALDVKPPAPQPGPLEQYAQIMGIRNAQQEQQLRQQQMQGADLENQQRQMDMQARQALNQAYAGAMTKNADGSMSFDADKLQQGLANGPAAYQIPGVMKGITEYQQGRINLQSSVAKLQQQSADMIGSAASAIKAAGYDPTLAHSLLDSLPPSQQTNSIRAMIDGDPAQFRQMVDTAIQNSPAQQKLQNAKDVAAIRANTPEMQQQNSWLGAQNKGLNPGDPGYKTPADYAQHKIDMQTQADITRETDPRVVAMREQLAAREAQQRQALSQGDPRAAAQLLIDGDATLSELKARGSTPEFIANTLAAAHQMSGGKYNAQQADAQFDVAKSPTNVAFFGSAKSLTDKGGTLDQLQDAAKDIPGGLIPAFNSIADWEKAATGSGPIAKYASIALGVADDYSKVMGGGQGSDTSRLQALQLVGAKQSSEQRAASIEGIRGAVNSQKNSRIGSNPVMQRMYGDQDASSQNAPKIGDIKTFPNGRKGKWDGTGWVAQ